MKMGGFHASEGICTGVSGKLLIILRARVWGMAYDFLCLRREAYGGTAQCLRRAFVDISWQGMRCRKG